ncbi:MAG: hypothetical protein ABI597_04990 [Gammaproteobacteria bacterium]
MSQLSLNQKTNRIVPWNLVSYIFCAWLFGIVILLLAQVFVGTNGLIVYPSGEDFTWMRYVQPNVQYSLHHSWWALASRNPLAPWWYWLVSPLILKYPWGLYFIRKLVDLFLAISTLLMVNELLKNRRPWIAVWTAILVLVWNFSAYLEQVLLIMLISIGFSILSIYFYLVYLRTDRMQHGYLIASLITFFIALGTYTLQCGTPLAIIAISLIDAINRPTLADRKKALKDTVIDILGYGFLFVLFILIWVTTSGPTSDFFELHPSLFIHNFLPSIKYFIWHQNTTTLYHSIIKHWHAWVIILVANLFALLFSKLALFRQMRIEYISNARRESLSLLLPLLVLLAISMPTLILESTSNMWGPGLRSEMMQQIFNPLAYLFTILLCIQLIRPFITEKHAKVLATVLMVFLCTSVTMISLEYNRKLFEQTKYERNLIAGIKTFVPELTKPMAILVKVKNFDWYDGHNPAITNLFIQYSYNSSVIKLETIGDTSSATTKDPIVFGSKEKGVYFPGIKSWVDYDSVLVLQADKKEIVSLKNLTPTLFSQDNVVFSGIQEAQLDPQHFIVKATCPTHFLFSVTPNGTGWSSPEMSLKGEPYIWMANTEATLSLTTSCVGDTLLSFKTFAPMTEDILESLNVSIAGQTLYLKKTTEPDGATIISAQLPASLIPPSGKVNLTFKVKNTVVATGGFRALAIPFNWIELRKN